MSDAFVTRYGPTALVTGAAHGIGRGFAEGLARRGLPLLLVDVDEAGLDSTAKAIREEQGAPVTTLVADLSDLADLDRVCEAGLSTGVGLLVNNAGVGNSAAFLEIELADHLSVLDINVRSFLVLTHRLAPPMCERGRGGLIFTSSTSAVVGPPGVAHYAATKAYARHLAEALYGELHGQGVDVLTLMPGLTRTRQVTKDLSDEAIAALPAMDPGPVAEAAIRALGRKRFVIPGFKNRLQAFLFPRLPRGPLLRKLGSDLTARAWHEQGPES
jgi:short-subunit dehydrogenase